ncbi:ferrichrome ABC transporter substrate-binding protein [Halobacteriales archaeon QS_1_68_17]|nr:MAG: ferrichrome ABC transporter substrate-binding protein [Halobacteriales archaeon QS_1_68_17]
MTDRYTHGRAAPSRRDYLKYSGAVVGGGVLAGCRGRGGPESTSTATETTGETADSTGKDTSYEVCMEPHGCHTLAEPPEEFVVYHQGPVDMMISLGQADGLVAAGFPSTFPTEYVDQIPGVSFDPSNVVALNEDGTPDKEVFYELGADVHLVDHNVAMEYFGLDESDIEELEANVGPFHGSWMRRQDYTDAYPHYELYEGLDKYAEVFQVKSRGRAFRELHDEIVESVRSQLPPVEERPSVAYLNHNYWDNGESVYVRNPAGPGYQTLPLRDLELPSHDAFADRHPVESTDFEILLEVDPEAIVYHTGLNMLRESTTDFEEAVVGALQNDPVAGEVTALKEGRVYPWHEFEQGPIMNLFNIELLAKGLYPERFGGIDPGAPLDVPDDEQLFDRQRVADIVNGGL